MQRFRRVLFSPLTAEPNPEAFARTVELARSNQAPVDVVGVVPAPSSLQRMLHPRPAGGPGQAARDQLLADLRERFSTTGDVPVEYAVDEGGAAPALVERVVRHGHDLLIVTSANDRRSRALVKRLLRTCPCPVYVVRPIEDDGRRVLAAIDPEPEVADMNELVLGLAAALARWLELELHIVHCWELYGESMMRQSAFLHVDESEIDEMRHEVEDEERAAVEALVEEVVGPDRAQVHIVEGPPGQMIPALIDELGIDRLVMGTVARAGVPGLVMGNTAEQVLDAVECSVLAVKPPGFVSPIAPPTS
ncbi:MAG: universal stress protein [Actinomycetota bacterium]